MCVYACKRKKNDDLCALKERKNGPNSLVVAIPWSGEFNELDWIVDVDTKEMPIADGGGGGAFLRVRVVVFIYLFS